MLLIEEEKQTKSYTYDNELRNLLLFNIQDNIKNRKQLAY